MYTINLGYITNNDFCSRWMDAVSEAVGVWVYTPIRRGCLRIVGQPSDELLEDLGSGVVVPSSSSHSQPRPRPTGFGAPFPPLSSERIRSRLIRRILDQPGQQGRAAQLAAAGVRHAVRVAQVSYVTFL
jgi:hypothetical protein